MSWRKGSNLTWLRGLAGVRQGEPLATRTSFGIGGPAEYFAEMSNAQSIQVVLDGCRLRGIPYMLLGAGTNLLIADAGIEGLVVRVVNRDHQVNGTRIRARNDQKITVAPGPHGRQQPAHDLSRKPE